MPKCYECVFYRRLNNTYGICDKTNSKVRWDQKACHWFKKLRR